MESNTNAPKTFRTWKSEYAPVTYFVARREYRGDREVARYDFGVLDHRGRKIGAIITCESIDMVEYDGEVGSLSDLEPGAYLAFRPHVTRNGVPYGASQADQLFKTETERRAAIEKYLASARKRAEKTGIPVGPVRLVCNNGPILAHA